MHSLPFRGRRMAVVLAAAAGLIVCACSSNSSSPTTTPSPSIAPPASSSAPASTGAEPTSGAAAIAAIKANWATFFNISTPTARRVALLQDGPALASVLASQAALPIAQGSSAVATTVTLTSTSQAAVIYNILLHGAVALKTQHGVAVYENGVWKVGLASFCSLLHLEALVAKLTIPAACPK